jgi:tetratricopeptide (TPR) repeat protein
LVVLKRIINIAKKALAVKVDFKLLSDFAWKLAQKMELDAAAYLLIQLEKTHPEEYNILANLGTVYELQGNVKFALLYITKAVQLSPESHYGSEWLHINILKSKLGLLNSYDISNFFELSKLESFNTAKLYKLSFNPTNMGKYHRDTLMLHLAYQLHERMFFIGKNDRLMAEMLYMFMQCMIHRGDYEYAAEVGELCIRYGYYDKYIFDALGYCLKKPLRKT